MKYNQIWSAVDKLAEMNHLSPSGLAKKAGLDSTTFNISKRIRSNGKKRWPSMESINKILTVCNCDFEDFYKLGTSDEYKIKTNSTPFCSMHELATQNKLSNEEILNRHKWSEINFPEIESNLIAVEVDNDEYEPLFKNGDVLIINTNCEIRKTDKVIIKYKKDNVKIFEFYRRTPSSLELKSIIDNEKTSINIHNIEWIKRIIWSSQ
jgi:phage repressor protein C with HTH and peptisase S24 domain